MDDGRQGRRGGRARRPVGRRELVATMAALGLAAPVIGAGLKAADGAAAAVASDGTAEPARGPDETGERKTMNAQIVLFDGFDPLDAVAPFEVLSAGGVAAGGALTVEFASAEGPREVPSGAAGGRGRGLVLHATAMVDPAAADLIVLPGAVGAISPPADGSAVDTVPALLARAMETPLGDLMRQAMANPKVTVATVCGGSLALAMGGLLAGRHAVTHHVGMPALAAAGAIAIPARVVVDGDLVTAGGVTSGLDLGLYLLERDLGPRIARAVEIALEYERRGTVWQNQGLEPASL